MPPIPLPRLQAVLATMGRRLGRREDSEHVQALIRVAFGLVISIYLYATIGPRFDIHVVCIGFELASCAIVIAILMHPQSSLVRRRLGAILDLGTTTYLMWTNGEAGAPLYGIYLWVIFGNGFRYGVRSLREAHAMSVAGFGAAIAFNPFWHVHSLMAGGFLILLAAVPFYGAVLLKDVKRAQDRAEQANEAKSNFLSAMSHEIRTPLNGIIGINALLRRTKVTPEQLDLINTLGISSDILLSLLDSVLDIAKIEAGKMAIEQTPFDLHAVIKSAVQIAATQAVSKGLRISTCLDAAVSRRVIGDPHRLRQVLTNLLANAIKFTQHGGVHLRVGLAARDPRRQTVRCEVIDTGVGMSPDALSKIFEPFVQADQSTTREYGGTGLGTTIAKQLIELMNGKMGASSDLGQGSTFWFEVPLPTQAPAEGEVSLAGIRILLGGIESPLKEQIIQTLEAVHAQMAATPAERAARMIVDAATTDRPWQVVIVNQIAQNNPVADLNLALSNATRKPGLVVLGPMASEADRMAMVHSPYTATLNTPIMEEHLFRAVQFAAQNTDSGYGQTVQAESFHVTGKSGGRPKVLVAEDNPTNRKIIAQILEYGGYDVSLSSTGTQAVEDLQHGDFDVVILDNHMPGMSGMEVAARYQALRGADAAPMIMLTADATAEARQQCQAAGMKAFLTKPIDPEMLFETIHALTGIGKQKHNEGTFAKQSAIQPETPILDESVLAELDHHAYSTRFIVDVVESFESDMLDLIERLAAAINAEDWSEIADIRHTIEGTASGSGATAIVGFLHKLKSLDTATPAQRQKCVDELRRCLALTLDAMKRFLDKRKTAPSRKPTRPPALKRVL